MKLTNNIECIKIPITPDDTVMYFPQNSSYNGKKVDSIITMIAGEYSPGVMSAWFGLELSWYLTLVNAENETVVKDFPITLSDWAKNVQLVNLNDEIRWDKSFVKIKRRPEQKDDPTVFFLYIYVIYQQQREVNMKYDNVITIDIPANYSGSFRPFVNTDNYGYLCRMETVGSLENYYTEFVTLRDRKGRTFDNVATRLMDQIQKTYDLNLNYFLPNWEESTVTAYKYPVKITLYFSYGNNL